MILESPVGDEWGGKKVKKKNFMPPSPSPPPPHTQISIRISPIEGGGAQDKRSDVEVTDGKVKRRSLPPLEKDGPAMLGEL